MSESGSGNRTQADTSSLEKTTQSNAPNKAYPFLKPPIERDELGRLGQYRVLRLLGIGGMGFVFEAEEITLHRRVALKVLRHDLGNELENRQRFLREARAAAAIHSDHVVTIYQIVEGDPPYLVMQYLTGESLQSRIEELSSITLREALEIARQTAEGLAAAHAIGLIHRDIKPANLWLEKAPGADRETNVVSNLHLPPPSSAPLGRVKILDFGLARRTSGETSLTSTGFIVGTPNYMSPEQASGIEVDPRSDLFSLGCVLYTTLTGELPFPGTSAMAVMMALANKTPISAHLVNSRIPKAIAEFVDRLLEKDPNKRPQSAREVAAELDKLLSKFTESPSLLLPLPTSRKAPAVTPAAFETLLTDNDKTQPRDNPSPPPSGSAVTHPTHHRSPLLWITFSLAVITIGIVIFLAFRKREPAPEKDAAAQQAAATDPIVVGVLHSRNGRMASIEKPIIDSTLLALEELNSKGGVLGHRLRILLEDGKSDPDEYARAAEKLLTADKAVAIFGCWTGTSRRTVRPVLERNNGLLFFPAATEGLEQSPRIVYLGPAPNQYLLPAVDYLTDTLKKKRIIVVGSDSIFPRTVAQIVMDHLRTKKDVEYLGAKFLPIAATSTFQFVRQISFTKPDAIINCIYGTANASFFADLGKESFTPARPTTMSISISQNEIKAMNPSALAGDYLAASYFQGVDRPEGKDFVQKMKLKYGRDTIATDAMGAAYGSVNLWAKTVTEIGSTEPSEVLKAIRGQEFEGPRGRVKIDPDNLHTWLPARIAKIRADGELDLVNGPGLNERIAPIPYPSSRTPERWDEFARGLNFQWNGKWQAPPEPERDQQ
jgi:urea transport system substrate-binding protein